MTTPTPTPDTSSQARKALIVVIFNILIILPEVPIVFYFASQTGAWQLFVIAWVLLADFLSTVVAFFMVRRGQIVPAIGQFLGISLILCITTAALVAGIGVPLGVMVFVSLSSMAFQTLSGQAYRAASTAIIVSCITMGLLHLARPFPQYVYLPLIQMVQIFGAIAVLIFVFTTVFKVTARPKPGAGGDNQIK